VDSANYTDGTLTVNFSQSGDRTIGIMTRTDSSLSDDWTLFNYGFIPSNKIMVNGITSSAKNNTVAIPAVGDQAVVAVSFSPLGCPHDFSMENSDESIIVVRRKLQSVIINGRSEGTAVVTIASTAESSKKIELQVTVGLASVIPITGITLNKSSTSIGAGSTETLIATLLPMGATGAITWASDDTDIATVVNGVVTGVDTGTAIITASAGGYNAMCEVDVT
jgi:uncharacterized protein YjdB